jgi:alkylated DNA repair dioxygenase AlkB
MSCPASPPSPAAHPLCLDAAGAPAALPAGLHVWRDALPPAVHDAAVAAIDAAAWDPSPLARRSRHYGYSCSFPAGVSSSDVDIAVVAGALPAWSGPVVAALAAQSPEAARHCRTFDQMIVNEYEAGQGIGRHVDAVRLFGDGLAGVSLLSGCCLRFTPLAAAPAAGRGAVEVYLPARAAMLMTGAARYEYRHEIPRRLCDGAWGARRRRLSLTFRAVLRR